MEIQSSKKLARMARILHNSEKGMANWVDFAQFTVNFESSITMVRIGKWFANFALFAGMVGFLVTWGCMWIFNCQHVCEWRAFCAIHNLKYKNTFISKMTMSVNGKTTGMLLLAIEAVCT